MKSIHINPIFRFSRTIIALGLAITLLFIFSCKKDKDSKSDQLKQKWNLVKRYDTIYNALSRSDTLEYDGQPGEYYEFGHDDSVTQSEKSFGGNFLIYKWYYKFNEANMTLENEFGTEPYQIRELTGTKLELYRRFTTGSHSFHIRHIFLER